MTIDVITGAQLYRLFCDKYQFFPDEAYKKVNYLVKEVNEETIQKTAKKIGYCDLDNALVDVSTLVLMGNIHLLEPAELQHAIRVIFHLDQDYHKCIKPEGAIEFLNLAWRNKKFRIKYNAFLDSLKDSNANDLEILKRVRQFEMCRERMLREVK